MQLLHGDCLELMRALPDRSVDLIATDPPYYKVKGDAWDRQWDTPAAFLAWFDLLAEQWQRILRPNGSLYTFAWPGIAAEIEVLIKRRFNVLQRITWAKPPFSTKAEMNKKADQRSFFPVSEAIIFAEHKGADIAGGDTGYVAALDALRGATFEPLRAYLDGERQRVGATPRQCNEALGNQMAGHYFSRVQWTLPTRANYEKLRAFLQGSVPDALARDFDDLAAECARLREVFEEQRLQYEDLRRPFSVTADVPYTDVWTYPTVSTRKGKHPCEKPLAMMEDIIRASSRPGAIVLDPFMGSGVTGEAAVRLGREFIGMEAGAEYFASACARIYAAQSLDPPPVNTRLVTDLEEWDSALERSLSDAA